MDSNTEIPYPSSLKLYPPSSAIIDKTMQEITKEPDKTLMEDEEILRQTQPNLTLLLDSETPNNSDFGQVNYKVGFLRAFRFFKNQAKDQGQPLPQIAQEYVTSLLQSREEDSLVNKNKKIIEVESNLSGRLGMEIRTEYPDFYRAINKIMQFNPYILKGMIDIVFIFQHFQNAQNLEAQIQPNK